MDPNPIKHPAVLLAHVRDIIEPILRGAGYRYECRNDPRRRPGSRHLWIDYSRGRGFVSLEWNGRQARLSLAAVDENGAVCEIAIIGFDGVRGSSELSERANQFIQCVQRSPYLIAARSAEPTAALDSSRHGGFAGSPGQVS